MTPTTAPAWQRALDDEGFAPSSLAPPPPALPPGSWPRQGTWAWNDYQRLPSDGRRYEILRGVLYMSPAPIYDHQFAVSELFFRLKTALHERGDAAVLTVPFDVLIPGLATPVQPDLVVLLDERVPVAGQKHFEGVPDLVVEVLSPASHRLDQHVKFGVYEEAGVGEYWIVDPKARTVTVFAPRAAGEPFVERGHWSDDESATSTLFEDLTVPVGELFP